jgi:multidrug transporter EmrE-like cation transporter
MIFKMPMKGTLWPLVLSVVLVLAGHFLMRWRAASHTDLANATLIERIAQYFGDHWILLAYLCALGSSVFWFQVLQRVPLNIAFPIYQGCVFVFIAAGSVVFFGETLSAIKLLGFALVLSGVILLATN